MAEENPQQPMDQEANTSSGSVQPPPPKNDLQALQGQLDHVLQGINYMAERLKFLEEKQNEACKEREEEKKRKEEEERREIQRREEQRIQRGRARIFRGRIGRGPYEGPSDREERAEPRGGWRGRGGRRGTVEDK
ncbi:eukaryotic translation initiation factor 3 subunit A-like [Anthonomus grandis grandis]|uniref:eukaryotic translation initiation factor 3 subunit A-like n=1 Tax=Anthonomus grandis grandis TaxID=2921223 RepID=UPI002165A852|nr:eukaryotic translation initiation factor 3 subunit A-like [Anthonomus grandis grandis]